MSIFVDTPNGIALARERRTGVDPRKLLEAVRVVGNGSFEHGAKLVQIIADRLTHAREKHPWPRDANNWEEAAHVVWVEADELLSAAEHETSERSHDESLDVIATAVRFCNREWEQSHDAATSPPCGG